jgi:type IV pilus assembly protein PilM
MKLPFGLGSSEVVTLSLEGSDVRLLSAEGSQVSLWAETKLAPGLVREGLVVDTAAVGKAIDELLTDYGVSRKKVVTALTGLRAIPRILTLPKIKANLLDDAVRREARKEMPLALDTLYLSWQTVAEKGDQRQIYLLGVSRELLDAHYQALQAAGASPAATDLKPLALVRAVNRAEAVIADLEEESLTIVLVVEGVPVIMRSFPFESGAGPLSQKVNQLVEELTQTIRFYNESHRESPLRDATPVILTGAVMADPAVVASLRATLDRTVELPDCPLDHPANFPVAQYLVNVGLAMKKV